MDGREKVTVLKARNGASYGQGFPLEEAKGRAGDAIRKHVSEHPEHDSGKVSFEDREYWWFRGEVQGEPNS